MNFAYPLAPGYRVYFGKQDDTLVILLHGGDKGHQQRDLKKQKICGSCIVTRGIIDMPTVKYEDELHQALRDPEEASTYINAALDGENLEVFLLALRQVVNAQDGVNELAKRTHKGRTSLYKTLSKNGNPYLKGTSDILSGLGLKLHIESVKS